VSDPIRIEALIPQPLPDLRRVALLLRVSGLPDYGFGVGSHLIHFSDMAPPEPPAPADRPGPDAVRPPSPYPDVALSILDQEGRELAAAYIVEHKEPELDFTLHLPASEPGALYTARAEMTLNDQVVQVVQVPFELG